MQESSLKDVESIVAKINNDLEEISKKTLELWSERKVPESREKLKT